MTFETFCKKTRAKAKTVMDDTDSKMEMTDERLKEYWNHGYTPKSTIDYILACFEESRREGEWEASAS